MVWYQSCNGKHGDPSQYNHLATTITIRSMPITTEETRTQINIRNVFALFTGNYLHTLLIHWEGGDTLPFFTISRKKTKFNLTCNLVKEMSCLHATCLPHHLSRTGGGDEGVKRNREKVNLQNRKSVPVIGLKQIKKKTEISEKTLIDTFTRYPFLLYFSLNQTKRKIKDWKKEESSSSSKDFNIFSSIIRQGKKSCLHKCLINNSYWCRLQTETNFLCPSFLYSQLSHFIIYWLGILLCCLHCTTLRRTDKWPHHGKGGCDWMQSITNMPHTVNQTNNVIFTKLFLYSVASVYCFVRQCWLRNMQIYHNKHARLSCVAMGDEKKW